MTLCATFAHVSDNDETEEIIAAGGVVLDSKARVLLVHRPKYDDWSFPKGKAGPGETIAETAIREVREETGLECRIVSELGSIRYIYESPKGKPRPKVVHYFLMKPESGSLSVNEHEIDRAEWYDAREAGRLLNYQHDRELLNLALASSFPEQFK